MRSRTEVRELQMTRTAFGQCVVQIFTALVVGACTTVFVTAAVAADAPSQPNIVLIVADDMGWNDVGFHGSEINTPHLDAIAEQGVELDRFYVQPTCSPTRSSLMTGKSSVRFGITVPIDKNSRRGIPLEETLLPEELARVGYQSLMTGKWHLGHAEKRYFPHHRGFEHFYGHVTGGIGYWDHTHGGGYDWQRNGTTVREEGYTTHLIVDEATALLARRDKARPTFLYVAFNAPHLPNEAPQSAIDVYRETENRNRRVHSAMVSELDAGIGRLLEALDREGMSDNTLIWFTSDNGGLNRATSPSPLVAFSEKLVSWFGEPLPIEALEFLRANMLDGGADNTPLRGGKTSVYEGGVRVPAAIWWPGHIEGGKSDTFITAQDVLPTLLEAAGHADIIANDLDGTTRLAALKSGETVLEHPDYFVAGLDGEALYRGDLKLVVASGGPFGEPVAELYNVRVDPMELDDIASEHPSDVREMRETIDAWPRGASIRSSVITILLDPDRFGGEEDREPWADVAK